jgi:glycosyltransferase involved in cell wall biosynthesis
VIVTPAVPHPFGDTAARWFYVLITELAARGHELAAVAATEEAETRVTEARERLAKLDGKVALHFHRLKVDGFALRRKWQNLVRPRSEMIQDRELRELLARELRQGCDVLHLELLSSGWLGVGNPRALLNVHSFDAIDWSERASMTARERKALWQAQRATDRLLHEITNVRLLTPRLKEAAEAINPAGHYWVVPFALDTTLYPLQPPATEPVVGMIGSMHWEPSRSAARRLMTRIWPLVKQRVAAARLYIAGWNAAKYLSDCASQPDVVLAENLEHPTEFFSKAAVMVYAPSRGSGMKVKVMESMAYGVPVVTTWEGMEGIEYQNGRECWVSESDEELAERICRLLENPSERGQMREAARSLMDERYSPRPVVDKMISVYEELIGSRKSDSSPSL